MMITIGEAFYLSQQQAGLRSSSVLRHSGHQLPRPAFSFDERRLQMSETWECPKCGQAFGNERARRSHLGWCGRSREISAETKQKISRSLQGRQFSTEHKRRISEAKQGTHLNAEHKQKLSEYERSSKTRARMANAARHRPPISDETKRRKSKAMSGANNPIYGKSRSPETREKLSKALRGNPKICGSNHYNWKGGPVPYGPDWSIQRDRARNRDNHSCQLCGVTEEELDHELSVHHIKPFRESKDNNLDNLICLCGNHGGRHCHIYCELHPRDCPEPRRHWLLPAAREG